MSVDPATIALSLAAGVLSFASPCVLPLIPSWLSYVAGVSLEELRDGRAHRGAVLARTALFVVGFSIVFVVLGVLFSGSAMLLAGYIGIINVVAGVIVILLGLNMIFDLWDFLLVERRVQPASRPRGVLGSALIGMAFGAGWTPCIGPMLAGILFLAGQSGSVAQGAFLLSVYSLGLGIPFLAVGLFFPRATALLARLRGSLGSLKTVAGVLLTGIGVLIAVGRFAQLNTMLVASGMQLQRWHAANPVFSRWAGFGAALLCASVPLLPWMRRRLRADSDGARPPAAAAVAVSVLLLLIAVLQAAGVVQVTALAAAWLSFQGI